MVKQTIKNDQSKIDTVLCSESVILYMTARVLRLNNKLHCLKLFQRLIDHFLYFYFKLSHKVATPLRYLYTYTFMSLHNSWRGFKWVLWGYNVLSSVIAVWLFLLCALRRCILIVWIYSLNFCAVMSSVWCLKIILLNADEPIESVAALWCKERSLRKQLFLFISGLYSGWKYLQYMFSYEYNYIESTDVCAQL